MKLMLIAIVACFCGCVSYNVDEDNVCKQSDVAYAIPDLKNSQGVFVPGSQSYTADYSKYFDKLNSAGATTTITVNKNNLTMKQGDLSWIGNITVSMESVNNKDYPSVVLTNMNLNSKQSTYDLDVNVDGNTLSNYFSQGEVKFNITVTPKQLPTSANLTHSVCLGVNVSGSKSL